VELRVLGPLEIVDDHGQPVDVGGTRPRTLLVDLALAHGRAVPADRLLDDVWGDERRPGRNSLQVHVSRLRRVLGDERIATRGGGYALELPADSLDAVRFDRLVAEGHAALHAGDPAAASRTLRTALSLWRGAPLAEFTDDDFARPVITRLEETRLGAIEDRVQADLALGRHGAVIPEVEALVQQHPLRERLWGLLMTALYRAGRQADALRAYQRARAVLAEELGIDPGPELQQLERAVLAQDDCLAPPTAPPDDTTEARTRRDRRGNLPSVTATLLGRSADLSTVTALVRDDRAVTIVGPGGVGKTRLAIEIGRALVDDFDDGVWIVELASVSDEADVAGAISGALLVESPPERDDMIDKVQRLGEFLFPRQSLLLLDNCEHVIGETAHIVDRLLARCPGVHVLATSREPLAIAGEALWPLAPLAIDDARDLFVARARGVAPGFTTDDATDAAIRALCTHLDGLPLAIELAAARVRAFTPADLLARLDDRFRLLTGGSRAALPRQQTLRAVVDWSYNLLFDDERRVFERTSVFAGEFTLEAAETVCGDDVIARYEVGELVARLVDKSLLVSRSTEHGVRFRLLQTLAQYGRERLVVSGENDAVRKRHAELVVSLVEIPDSSHGSAELDWLARMTEGVDDIRVAMEWALDAGDADLALAITGGLGWYWNMGGRVDDTWRWLCASLMLGEPQVPTRRIRALAWAGAVGMVQDANRALAFGAEAVERARSLDERSALAHAALLHGSMLSDYFNRARDAVALLDEARHAFWSVGRDWDLAMASLLDGAILMLNRDFDRAQAALSDSADRFERIGNAWGRGIALRHVGDVAMLRGRYDEAMSALQRAVSGLLAVGAATLTGSHSARLGYLSALRDDSEGADRWHARALAAAEQHRHVPVLALTYDMRGLVLRRRGCLDDAEACHHVALTLYDERGVAVGRALSLVSLGYIAELRGDGVDAEQHHRAGFEAARAAREQRIQALALEGLAGAASLHGDAHTTGIMLGAADALREATGGPLPPAERIDVDRAIARVDEHTALEAARAAARADPGPVLDQAGGGSHVEGLH
jgi:predicted ATPase/DNA-binding SARP family transcriptional activator